MVTSVRERGESRVEDATRPLGRRTTTALLLATVASYGWIVHQMVHSTDVFFGDDWEHLLISRQTLRSWRAVLSVWGRPATTATYLPAARGGLSTVHLEDAILVALCTVLVVAGARLAGFQWWPAAGILLLAQPLFAILSFGVMPQLPFCILLAAALLLRRTRFSTASLVVASFLPLARLEGIVVVAVWFVLEVVARRYKTAPLLGVGVALWALLGWIAYHDPLWLWKANSFLTTHTKYEAAGLHYFPSSLAIATGAVVAGLAVFGLVRTRGRDPLVPTMVIALSIFYALSWEFGAFQTYPTPIYLVTLAVGFTELALCGLGEFSNLDATPWWRDGLAIAFGGLVSASAVLELYLATPTWVMQGTVVVVILASLVARFGTTALRAATPPVLLAVALVIGIVATPTLSAVTRHGYVVATLAYVREHPGLVLAIAPLPSIQYGLGQQAPSTLPYAAAVAAAPLHAIVNWNSSRNPILGGVTVATLEHQGYTERWIGTVGGIEYAFFQRSSIPSAKPHLSQLDIT